MYDKAMDQNKDTQFSVTPAKEQEKDADRDAFLKKIFEKGVLTSTSADKYIQYCRTYRELSSYDEAWLRRFEGTVPANWYIWHVIISDIEDAAAAGVQLPQNLINAAVYHSDRRVAEAVGLNQRLTKAQLALVSMRIYYYSLEELIKKQLDYGGINEMEAYYYRTYSKDFRNKLYALKRDVSMEEELEIAREISSEIPVPNLRQIMEGKSTIVTEEDQMDPINTELLLGERINEVRNQGAFAENTKDRPFQETLIVPEVDTVIISESEGIKKVSKSDLKLLDINNEVVPSSQLHIFQYEVGVTTYQYMWVEDGALKNLVRWDTEKQAAVMLKGVFETISLSEESGYRLIGTLGFSRRFIDPVTGEFSGPSLSKNTTINGDEIMSRGKIIAFLHNFSSADRYITGNERRKKEKDKKDFRSITSKIRSWWS